MLKGSQNWPTALQYGFCQGPCIDVYYHSQWSRFQRVNGASFCRRSLPFVLCRDIVYTHVRVAPQNLKSPNLEEKKKNSADSKNKNLQPAYPSIFDNLFKVTGTSNIMVMAKIA